MTAGANWKSLIICPNQMMSGALVESLGRALPQGAALQVPSYPPGHALGEMLATHLPTVCLVTRRRSATSMLLAPCEQA